MAVDLAKLQVLRDEHAALKDRYRTAAALLRSAKAAHAEVVSNYAPDPRMDEACRLWHGPAADMAALSAEDLKSAGLDPRLVRRLLDAHRRAEMLQTDAEPLRRQVRASLDLLQRLEDFARGNQQSTDPVGHAKPPTPKRSSFKSPYMEPKEPP